MARYSVEVDVFDEKERILESFSDSELKEELERRDEEDDHVELSKSSLEIYYCLDLDDIFDEILSDADDKTLIDELEDRGHTVNEDINHYRSLKHLICHHIGFRSWSSKEQILKELDNYL